jgi:hypothetical protein
MLLLDELIGLLSLSSPLNPDDSWAHLTFYPTGTGKSFSGMQSSQGVKLRTHLHLVLRLKYVELYLHSPMRIHYVVHSYAQG